MTVVMAAARCIKQVLCVRACVCVCVCSWQTLVELRDRRKSCDDLSLVINTPTFNVLLALMDVVTQVQLCSLYYSTANTPWSRLCDIFFLSLYALLLHTWSVGLSESWSQ